MRVEIPTTDRNTIAILARAAHGGLIGIPEAAKRLGTTPRVAALKLAALARRGWLSRARRGLYLVVPLEAGPGRTVVAEDSWVVARESFSPCYIGGWSAAEHWALTEQIFRSTLVVTAAPVRSTSVTILGHEFRLFRVPKRRVEGAVLVWRGAERVRVSDKERTLVDCLRHPGLCGGVRHLASMMTIYASGKDHDFSKLIATAGAHGSGAAWKRLGYLAEILWGGEPRVLEAARRNMTTGYVSLDPAVSQRGRLLRRWRLWINASVDAAALSA